jgi:heme/copper-type cytochrome/quinol oxidase subunit 3
LLDRAEAGRGDGPDLRRSRIVSRRATLDVSGLPTYAYGHSSVMWWATLLLVLIEGTAFAIAVVAYFYLRGLAESWPPSGQPPSLLYGTINTAVMLSSVIPNHWTKRAARREDLQAVRWGISVCLAFALVFLILRIFEFRSVNTTWHETAYGSIVIALLTLHTVHLVTDFIDSAVLTTLTFTGPLEGKRFVDVAESADYWYFVVATWIPIYLTVYWAPRLQ